MTVPANYGTEYSIIYSTFHIIAQVLIVVHFSTKNYVITAKKIGGHLHKSKEVVIKIYLILSSYTERGILLRRVYMEAQCGPG